jgi:hypothetical protein
VPSLDFLILSYFTSVVDGGSVVTFPFEVDVYVVVHVQVRSFLQETKAMLRSKARQMVDFMFYGV